MQPAATSADAPATGAWSITREGSRVASVSVSEAGGKVVVDAAVATAKKQRKPLQFDNFEAADAFIRDLLQSFTYLGCDISAA